MQCIWKSDDLHFRQLGQPFVAVSQQALQHLKIVLAEQRRGHADRRGAGRHLRERAGDQVDMARHQQADGSVLFDLRLLN